MAEEAPRVLTFSGFHVIVARSAGNRPERRRLAGAERGGSLLADACGRIFTMQQRCHAPNLRSGTVHDERPPAVPAGFDRSEDDDEEDAIHEF